MKSSKSLDLNLDSLIANLRQGAEDFCNSRAVVDLSCRDYESAAKELERLRQERDEARRLACEFWVMDGSGYSSSSRAKEDALSRGWDCFKEKTDDRGRKSD
jgi:hypothetical protein